MSGHRDPDDLLEDLNSIKDLLSEDDGPGAGGSEHQAEQEPPEPEPPTLRDAQPPRSAPPDTGEPGTFDLLDAAEVEAVADEADAREIDADEFDPDEFDADEFDEYDAEGKIDHVDDTIDDQIDDQIDVDESNEDLQVPVLDDVVAGALEVDESPLIEREDLDPDGPRLLTDDTIRALLGDEWKHSADRILTEARESIQEAKDQWSPQQTDELVEALKVRIDATVDEWLSSLIAERIQELRDELVSVLHRTTTNFIAKETGSHDGE